MSARAGIDRATRARIGLEVGLAVLLALAAVLLVTWLAERPGLRLRVDLTADRSSSLDPLTARVIRELPGEVEVDLFFRPDAFPFAATSAEAQQRMRRLLALVREWSDGRVKVTDHDVAERSAGGSAWEQRAAELGLDAIRPPGVAVVSFGPRRHVLQLRGDIAEVDPGNPDPNRFVPARLVSFRGEEALVSAIFKVTRGDRLKACFASGHGEPDVFGDDEHDLGRLFHALVDDGFDVERWHGESQGPIPADCAVLALIGPAVPYTEVEAGWIRAYLERGGRLVAAPARDARPAQDSLETLLEERGVRALPGIVSRPVPSPTTGEPTYGLPQCAGFYLGPEGMRPPHEITRPLRQGNRSVFLVYTRALEHAEQPPGTRVLELLATDELAWRDLPEPNLPDQEPDPTEERGPFVVGMAAVFPALAGAAAPDERAPDERAPSERQEGRLVVLGSALAFGSAEPIFLANRDLLLNAFNWAASREFLVRVSPRDPTARILDLGSARVRRALSAVCLAALPGLLLACGLVTAWRRRR